MIAFRPLSLSLVLLGMFLTSSAEPVKARYVRVSLPDDKRILTLAEVEVISDGANIAPSGQAIQSSTGHGGVPERAIDGNKNPDFGKGGQTHTDGAGSSKPWWELDLGNAKSIERIQIWNRSGLDERLADFSLELLDADRKAVFARELNPAPDGSISFLFGKEVEVTTSTHDGKPIAVITPKIAVPAGYRDPSPFAFDAHDVVAVIGNGLADRMQHDGWMETWLQVAAPDKSLMIRNLSVTGDQVDRYPRSDGFTPMDDYLRHVGADVILAFFGYNESFAGAAGLPEFETKLAAMIKRYREAQPNGESFPRLVLFSPIAHENLGDPNLPDGSANNKRLALYTAAMQKVAQHEGVAFVDLFTVSQQLYDGIVPPLTINGIHLNELGNRHVGELIAEALVGKGIDATENELARVREAVLDKNWHWHNRYRATDGNDVWGSRSTLSFVDGQTNADVLVHELNMLDRMTANRDPIIWARAQGSDAKVDDSNVPVPVAVTSNVGGGSKSSNAEKEGNLQYVSGEEGLAMMTVPEGFKMNLFADEKRFPEIANPVQMQVDGRGRIWVAAWATYPKWEPLKPMNDALVILPDDDGDGVADRSVVFAEVHNPLGFEFWNGGVVVTSQPDILFLKDTDGDDVADVRVVLLQGIGSSDTHHAANNLIYGPDGGIYWQSGIFLQNNHEHPWGASLESRAAGMYRFDPRRYTISFHATNSPNSHGISFDEWGYHYASDGTSGNTFQVRPEGRGFKMHPLIVKEVRPVPANEIVSSSMFPEDYQGRLLICNTIGFLGIKQYDLHRDGYSRADGKTFAPGEVWGEPAGDLLSSTDKNFRPTDSVFGSDGALYVSDWHNVIIGHMQHNIRDPNRDHKHGRIYRMSYPGRERQAPVKIDGEPVTALLKSISNPVLGVRHRIRVELSERPSAEVFATVPGWLATLDRKSDKDAIPLLEALWLHQQFNVRDEKLLAEALGSPVEHVRIAAATVKHFWNEGDPVENLPKAPVEAVIEKIEVTVPPHLTGADAEAYRLGSAVFHREAHCVTCHQATGLGMANIYPPLVGSPWISGSEERLIKATLHGLWGPMEVNGVLYDPAKGVPPMTAFKALLDDKELAAVLTYVRNSWGNKAPVVSPDTVKTVREATKDLQMFLKPEDLLKDHPLE